MSPEQEADIWRTAWEFGVDLPNAPYRFGHPDLLQELRAIEAKPFPKPEPVELSDSANWMETLTAGLQSFAPTIERLKESTTVATKLEEYMHVRVNSGEYMAIGYSLPRTAKCKPIQVPSDVWNSKVDWKKATVSGNGLQFVAVRIVPFREVEKRYERLLPPPEAITAPPRGRPSVKEDIFKAYETLKAQGSVDPSKSMASHYEAIRRLLCDLYPDRKGQLEGIADETIRQAISSDFKELQLAKKQ